ncbi:helix-turn-helix domain-containing protein [Mycobacterium marinum]
MLAYLDALARGFADETPSRAQESQSEHDVPLSADEAAEILGCSTQWVRRIAADLDGRQVAGRWIFHRSAVMDYAEARRGA